MRWAGQVAFMVNLKGDQSGYQEASGMVVFKPTVKRNKVGCTSFLNWIYLAQTNA